MANFSEVEITYEQVVNLSMVIDKILTWEETPKPIFTFKLKYAAIRTKELIEPVLVEIKDFWKPIPKFHAYQQKKLHIAEKYDGTEELESKLEEVDDEFSDAILANEERIKKLNKKVPVNVYKVKQEYVSDVLSGREVVALKPMVED